MSRALRIEYEGAWYHIMNRGAGRQIIFHNEAHYNLFLKLLSEIHNRYRMKRPRQVAIYLACKLSSHKHQTIAEHFSQITYAGIAKIYQRLGTKLQSDHMLAEEIFRLEMRLKI
jgi:chromosomal replication initiation ATPase DnaA